jgi:SAM-dependent methyltransferase
VREVVHREHDDADHWWFRARRSIFRQLLARYAPRTGRPLAILDLGPGGGVNLPVLREFGQVCCLDLDRTSLQRCRAAGATGLRADATRPPLRRGSIDLLCALDVLEHLDDDGRALAAWAECLQPEGRLLLTVPAFGFLWGRQDVLAEHRRRYGRRQLRERLTAAGFELERLTFFNTLLFPPVLAFRLALRPFLSRAVRGGSDLGLRLPRPLEQLLYRSFAAEGPWLLRRDLPVGVSLLAVARRAAAPGP